MAILVTRPAPGNAKTAAALKARGHDVLLSPMLRFEPVAFEDDGGIAFDAVILSSANAVRAIENHAARPRLMLLPVFAVGGHTAQVARDAGFTNITIADGDAISLRERILESAAAGKLKKKAALCYLAGADLTRDPGGLQLGLNPGAHEVLAQDAILGAEAARQRRLVVADRVGEMVGA